MRPIALQLLLTISLISAIGCANSTSPQPLTPSPAPPTETPLPPPTPTVIPDGLYVDATAPSSPISPLVYGTNYGPWLVVTVDVQEEFEASGLTYLRFPGGRWGDTHDIREYHIDQFMDLAATIDAEVTISVRLLGGTPEKAAELVRYVNIEEGHGVTYWSIGNEPSLFIDLQDAPEWDTTYYNEQWRLFATAMLEVDPDIQLIGPNIHQITADPTGRPKDPSGNDWLETFLQTNGDLVDVVTFHRYPFPISRTDPIPTIDQLRDNPQEWDDIIPAVRETVIEITGEDKPLGIGEINSNYTDTFGFETSPDGFYNAIWWGDVLGRLINQEVDMVNHFALTQIKNSGWGMLGKRDVRPTYYVYQLYQQFGDELLFSETDDPYVSIVAARRDDGAITVMLTNLTDEAQEKPLQIVGVDTAKADVWTIEPEVFAKNLGEMEVGSTVTLPSQSMRLLVFDGE